MHTCFQHRAVHRANVSCYLWKMFDRKRFINVYDTFYWMKRLSSAIYNLLAQNRDSLRGTIHCKIIIKPSSNMFRLAKLLVYHVGTNSAIKHLNTATTKSQSLCCNCVWTTWWHHKERSKEQCFSSDNVNFYPLIPLILRGSSKGASGGRALPPPVKILHPMWSPNEVYDKA